MIRVCLALLLLGLAVATPAAARDGNPQGIPVGHRAIGLGGAFTAVGGDGSALWYNPAGLGGAERQGLSGNLTLYQWRAQEAEDFANFNDIGLGDLESSDFGDISASLAYLLPLGERGPNGTSRHGVAVGLFVPDDDAYDARVDASLAGNGVGLGFKASDVLQERTYWFGLGYGYDSGQWGIGVSAFIAYHSLSRQTIVSVLIDGVADANGAIRADNMEAQDATYVLQIGGLYRPRPNVTLGASIRSPGLGTFLQSGEALVLSSGDADFDFVDRHDTKALRSVQWQPLRGQVGVAWKISPALLLSFELQGRAPIERYAALKAPPLRPRNVQGEVIEPRTPEEADALIARTVDLTSYEERHGVLNSALGFEWQANADVSLRLGLYTDFSTLNRPDPEDLLDAEVDIYTGVFSLGIRGERGSTDLGILVRNGSGRIATDVNTDFEPTTVDFQVRQVGIFLAGSANL